MVNARQIRPRHTSLMSSTMTATFFSCRFDSTRLRSVFLLAPRKADSTMTGKRRNLQVTGLAKWLMVLSSQKSKP